MNNKCKGCTERHPACQDRCEYALENKRERDALKAKIRKENLGRKLAIDVKINSVERFKRRIR